MVPFGGAFIELGLMTLAPEMVPPELLPPPLPPPPPLLPLLLLPQAATSTPPVRATQISAARRLDTSSPSSVCRDELCHRGGKMAPASCGRLRRRPGRRADDEPQIKPLRAGRRTLERRQQQPCAAHAALLERLRDGREPDVAGYFHVIEADHRQLGRHPHPGGLGGLQDAEGLEVGRRHDRGGRRVGGE